MITNLTGGWTYSTFGFISATLAPIPYVLFLFGARLRASSKYNLTMSKNMMKAALSRDEEMQLQEASRR